MKKLLTLLFAAAMAISMSSMSFAQDSSGMDKKETKAEKKAAKKEKKEKKKAAKEEKKEEKKDEMKK